MLGSLQTFNSEEEDWKTYLQRANLYFIANDIEDGIKQKAITLTIRFLPVRREKARSQRR